MSTRDKIIDSSIVLFSKYGYEGTTLTNIAQGAGIKKPSLYAHFNSKEDIFLCSLNKITNEYEQIVKDALNHAQHSSTEKKLFTIVLNIYKELSTQDHIAEFFYRYLLFPPKEMENKIREIIEQSDQNFSDLIKETIEYGKQNKEIDHLLPTDSIVKSYLCIMGGIQVDMRYYTFSQFEMERHLSQIWEVFWRGVKLN